MYQLYGCIAFSQKPVLALPVLINSIKKISWPVPGLAPILLQKVRDGSAAKFSFVLNRWTNQEPAFRAQSDRNSPRPCMEIRLEYILLPELFSRSLCFKAQFNFSNLFRVIVAKQKNLSLLSVIDSAHPDLRMQIQKTPKCYRKSGGREWSVGKREKVGIVSGWISMMWFELWLQSCIFLKIQEIGVLSIWWGEFLDFEICIFSTKLLGNDFFWKRQKHSIALNTRG